MNKYMYVVGTIQRVTRGGGGHHTDKHLPQVPLQVNFFMTTFALVDYLKVKEKKDR